MHGRLSLESERRRFCAELSDDDDETTDGAERRRFCDSEEEETTDGDAGVCALEAEVSSGDVGRMLAAAVPSAPRLCVGRPPRPEGALAAALRAAPDGRGSGVLGRWFGASDGGPSALALRWSRAARTLDVARTGRGAAAAATRPRPRRGYSVEAGRGAAAAWRDY